MQNAAKVMHATLKTSGMWITVLDCCIYAAQVQAVVRKETGGYDRGNAGIERVIIVLSLESISYWML